VTAMLPAARRRKRTGGAMPAPSAARLFHRPHHLRPRRSVPPLREDPRPRRRRPRYRWRRAAMDLANGLGYGLAAGIYTSDISVPCAWRGASRPARSDQWLRMGAAATTGA
jgi:hypothetical protein